MEENNQNPMEPMQPMEPMETVQPVQDNTQGQYQQYQAPQPEQPQYQPQPQYQAPQKNGSGFGVAALVLGILALLGCWVPYVDIALALLAFIFGIIGIVKNSGKGQAIAGLVLSILAGVVTIIVMMFVNTILGLLGWVTKPAESLNTWFGSNTSTVQNSVSDFVNDLFSSAGNSVGDALNSVGGVLNSVGNEIGNVANRVENTLTNSTTGSTSSVDSKKSTVDSPAKIGEWTTASALSDGEYPDVPVKVNKVTRGAEAEALLAGVRKTNLTDGCEWIVIDYSVDMAPIKETYGSKSLSMMYFHLRGNDGKTLKYGGKTWILTGSNLDSTSSIKTSTYNGRYVYQIPKGCTDYLIEVESSSKGTTAYIKGE